MRRAAIAVVVLVVGGFIAAGCSGQERRPAEPTGRSTTPTARGPQPDPAALASRWWTWTESVRADRNPIDDSTGESCGMNQPRDVWFLAGTHGGTARRTCSIPSGRSVFFPVLNQICPVEPGQTATRALEACTGSADSAMATLDDEPLEIREVATTAAFVLPVRAGSRTGLPAGSHQVVTWGLWVGPLHVDRGKHTLTFEGTSGSFATAVTYRLSVG